MRNWLNIWNHYLDTDTKKYFPNSVDGHHLGKYTTESGEVAVFSTIFLFDSSKPLVERLEFTTDCVLMSFKTKADFESWYTGQGWDTESRNIHCFERVNQY